MSYQLIFIISQLYHLNKNILACTSVFFHHLMWAHELIICHVTSVCKCNHIRHVGSSMKKCRKNAKKQCNKIKGNYMIIYITYVVKGKTLFLTSISNDFVSEYFYRND